jgi:CBS domain-containing protein
MNSSPAMDVAAPILILRTATAAELMATNLVSIRADATVPEAVALLTGKGISAVPVIDEAGRAVGVLSRADLLIHEREQLAAHRPAAADNRTDARGTDPARVRDLMTPVVLSITPQASAARVVEEMLALNVHRLFVVDRGGVLVGVISSLDVLRQLHP